LRDEGRAARTIGSHLSAIKAFTRWLTEHHKLPRDPLASVKKPNPETDRRRERRMLLPEEWQHLEAATEAGPDRYRISGAERLMLYRAAIQTGFRSSELRSLTRGRLYLDANLPYVTCKAGSTKNRREARQYIQPDLAATLKAHIATKSPKATVFSLPHESSVAQMLRDDLSEARRLWIREANGDPQEYAQRQESDFLADTNHEKEVLDFHSLRHTCGAWLSMTGAHPKTVQTVMRHSSITLTMDTYGHLFPGQEAEAVDRLQEMLNPPEALRATGTDSQTAQRLAQRTGRDSGRPSAMRCESQREPTAQTKTPKSLEIADLGDDVRPVATGSESSGGGTRTPDSRIMIPLL